MDEPDIVCEGLVRIFAVADIEVQALQGLDLTVDRGELVALVGASGSGKSTLLSILSALDSPTAGVARVAGRDLPSLSARDRVTYRREIVGFVWQQTARNLLPYLSAKENVQLARAIGGDRSHPERALDLLDLAGVADVADRRPAELSGGQQQRVAIAVALANDPRVLLADEPTGDLDEHASAEVLATFEAVNRELGTTALIVTHDPAVSDHVQRTVQIRDGRTSTEVLRWTHTDDEGQEHAMAEEFVVLDRVGRMQLPTDYMESLELRDRVRLELNPDHVGVWRGDTRAPAPGGGAATDASAETADAGGAPAAAGDAPEPPTRRSLRDAEKGSSDE
ncbi:ABC-type lipoprotein export system ATPase subunit [Microbacterium terrae]|uniref:Lipoprotein-releasing system ATP-binding protein LolD n=1 Tax=Microbacterium terrae TaxID=69369 RepID=A0A0M2GZF3_9MICO|nr:ABC transporter ATP-binding protein [Microbacterium terrae]KJL39258.1 Lipoprotein-releasing system ATP-binding protein LolD [Microbacterium terrae]MBP1076808.1 ABC-type lipoprotein export system ATPase subunit [Microbacterium terrae]GLJ99402.1 ABC transporter ATP-binding protein [Microbacterium terrae]